MRAQDNGERIVAEIDPPTRPRPERVVVRFRHPEKARLVGAAVNGRPVDSFDPEKEWVILPGLRERTVVEARFAPE